MLITLDLFVSETKCLRYVFFYEVYRCTTVTVHLNIYVPCGIHICSVIHFKYVYSGHYYMVDNGDVMCDT